MTVTMCVTIVLPQHDHSRLTVLPQHYHLITLTLVTPYQYSKEGFAKCKAVEIAVLQATLQYMMLALMYC